MPIPAHKHKYYLKGYVVEKYGKVYCFECEHCWAYLYIKFNMFWFGHA